MYTAAEGRNVSLAEARDKAIDVRRLLKQGVNPSEKRKAEKVPTQEADAARPFGEIASDWLKRQGNKTRSGNRRFADLQRLAFPMLGDRPIGDIKRNDIVRLLDRIEGNGVRTVIVEDASRFARELVVQELGIALLAKRGVRLLTRVV